MTQVKYSGVEQLVARKAHNLEVAGSSPVPAPNEKTCRISAGFFVGIILYSLFFIQTWTKYTITVAIFLYFTLEIFVDFEKLLCYNYFTR